MAYSATDRFQLLTGRFEGKQQVLLGRDEALEAASQVDVSPYARPLSKVMARQREALGQSDAPVTRAFLFTDLQRSVTDIENWTNDTLIHTVIAPLASASPDNLSIDSVWFDSPVRRVGQSEILHVRLQNYGEQELVNVPLRLDINDRQRALASFSILGGATVDTTLRFSSEAGGNHWGFVSMLRELAPEVQVLERVRYVRDGRLVTSAGVSAGIDMSLWLVGQIFGVEHARKTQLLMEYDPAPPYAAEV